MRKKILLSFIMIGVIFCTGCFNKENNIVSTLKNKIEKSTSYHITGTLEISNNESTYKYDVESSYKKSDYFRVSLKNKTNDHEQIILKNSEGVFVLTPSLNKSFKFQSEWPYNNSQSYLLQTLLDDIENDKDKTIIEEEDEYIITVKVTYSNNKNLVNQKIYVDKKGTIKKVEVLNKEGIVKIKMTYDKIDLKATFDDKYFNLTENMNLSDKTSITTSKIENSIYPMYMPENTYLESQETISTEDGERKILTFSGDNPFMLVEETVTISDVGIVIPVYGDVELLTDTFGYISDGVASWISNGIEYYAVSETLATEELLEVINSISVLPVGK